MLAYSVHLLEKATGHHTHLTIRRPHEHRYRLRSHPEGTAALDYAIAEARRSNRTLVVINSSRGEALVDKRYAAIPEIDRIEHRLGQEGIEHLILRPVRGHDAANEVLDAAEEHEAELIVIGLRRRTPVGKLIMGSTAQRILLEAPCPVTAVKAEPS